MKMMFLLAISTVLLVGFGAKESHAGELPPNALAGTVSPYLALHADDPVHWQLWNEDTLALAEGLARPIFISSGYFACHWCHVMQRESFHDPRVADLLNAHFVPVKIDREVDIATDELLIRFMREQNGIAGWPLNVITSPDARPLAGLLYAPPDVVIDTLSSISTDWPERLAAQLADGPGESREGSDVPAPAPDEFSEAEWVQGFARAFVDAALSEADDLQGGFGDQARFPHPPRLRALLAFAAEYPWIEDFLKLTLDAMAGKGLRDHIEGGFFRYTVDPDWETPHFEKMLYDNAQLADLYLLAAEVLDEPRWREVAFDTLDFMIARLAREDGGFMSAVSALDGDGSEGGDVLWTPAQLGRVLPTDLVPLAASRFGLHRPPTFEAGHLLIPRRTPEELAARLALPEDLVEGDLARMQLILRENRMGADVVRDDKAVIAWNGLALRALAQVVRLDPSYLQAGERLAAFLQRHVSADGSLPRAIDAAGRVLGPGTLEDYAFVASGLLAWHRLTGEPQALDTALLLADSAWMRFHDGDLWHLEQRPLLRYGGGQRVLEDHFMPSPTSMLLPIAHLPDEDASSADHGRRASLTRALREVDSAHALSQGAAISELVGFGSMRKWSASQIPEHENASCGAWRRCPSSQ